MAMRKLKEEAELFHAHLRQNGLKKTYQKDLILETFLNVEGHLSVDDIYALVKKKDKRVGVVTVFRTLEIAYRMRHRKRGKPRRRGDAVRT